MSCRFDFSGKKIVVTGGSQGIGRDICESLAASGATVYAMARNGQALEELQKKFPSKIIPLVCDVTAPVEELEAILAPHAPYDGLVNNAGVAVLETAMEARAESIDRLVARGKFGKATVTPKSLKNGKYGISSRKN